MVAIVQPREVVLAFAERMEEKLSAVEERHPDGWGGDTVNALYTRADDRMNDLYIAIENNEDAAAIGKKAVDVANWMMMIADNLGFLDLWYGK